MTNANIAMILPNNSIASIYIHKHADVENLGKILISNYNNPAKVLDLLELGDAEYIGESLDISNLYKNFGTNAIYSKEFVRLPEKRKNDFIKQNHFSKHSLFYGRDFYELDTSLKIFPNLNSWLNLKPKLLSYLYNPLSGWVVSTDNIHLARIETLI